MYPSLLLLLLLLLLPFLCHQVVCNTEIINLTALGNWITSSDVPDGWTNEPCDGLLGPHPLWVLLDLAKDTWAPSYSSFTLRVSWPASSPADVAIALYDLAPDTNRTTHTRYARISTVHAHEHPVPLTVILEPLYWGVLPASLLPTLGFLALVMLVAIVWVVPWVLAYLDPVVQQVREDKKTGSPKEKER